MRVCYLDDAGGIAAMGYWTKNAGNVKKSCFIQEKLLTDDTIYGTI